MKKIRLSSFDFDTPVERKNTSSLKWDRYRGSDILPLWVADMDFKAPPAVLKALREHIDHGVFGYTLPPYGMNDLIATKLEKDHGWRVHPDWIVWIPGLVTGINIACRTAGTSGDEIMTCVPVYPPFLNAPFLSDRILAAVPHREENKRYVFDFPAMERSASSRTRMFLLCNPQNPTGRVFTGMELESLADFCIKHDLILCSDEIHCGLVLDNNRKHLSIASLHEEIARRTITLLAPSKTYNLPGLGCSLAVIPDRELRKRFRAVMEGIVPHVNALGFTAAFAAYRDSEDWRLSLIDYLRKNSSLVEESVSKMPGLRMHHVEGTYLAWIDCRSLPVPDAAAFFEAHGIGLSSSEDFGAHGFVRLNFGCPRSTLSLALERMQTAVNSLENPGE